MDYGIGSTFKYTKQRSSYAGGDSGAVSGAPRIASGGGGQASPTSGVGRKSQSGNVENSLMALNIDNNEDNWTNIEPLKPWWSSNYEYKTDDGTSVWVSNIDSGTVRKNKVTGEIVIDGVTNANVQGSGSSIQLTITNSQIDSINTGGSSDTIHIEDSKIGTIHAGNGDDIIEVVNSEVDWIHGDNGHDKISLKNSTVNNNVDGSWGNDRIIAEDSTISGKIIGWGGDDFIVVNRSKVGEIEGHSEDDTIFVTSSTVNKIDAENGDDVVIINSSENIGEIYTGNGQDIVVIDGSNVQKLDAGNDADSIKISNGAVVQGVAGGSGKDRIVVEGSTAVTIDGGKGSDEIVLRGAIDTDFTADDSDVVTREDLSIEELSLLETLDEDSIDQAEAITNSIVSQYITGNITSEQESQAMTLDFFTQNLENMETQFTEQENEDGAVSDAYNWVKQLVNLGVSKDDIKAAIAEQRQMINEMQGALNGEGSETFGEVFKRWTGVEYSQENVEEYRGLAQKYTLAMTGMKKAALFSDSIARANNLGKVLELYTEYYGSEEKGRAKLNEYLQEALANNPEEFRYISSIEINENNELVRYFPETYGASGPEPGTPYTREVESISGFTNIIAAIPRAFDEEKYVKEFVSTFESSTGEKIADLQVSYIQSQVNTFGTGNAFQKLIDRYCAEQEGFIDSLSSALQIGGMGLIAVGGIVSLVCPPAGMVIMGVGKWTSLSGMFGDNVLELVDNVTSENGLSGEELWDLAKETVKEFALYYSGKGINGLAEGAKKLALDAGKGPILAFLAEAGTDVSLSLLTDLMITGEVDLTGEGISQLLGIITGIAGAKINKYKTESFGIAGNMRTETGDFDAEGARSYLKERGLSKKDIRLFFKSFDAASIKGIAPQSAASQNPFTDTDAADSAPNKLYDDPSYQERQAAINDVKTKYNCDSYAAEIVVGKGYSPEQTESFLKFTAEGVEPAVAEYMAEGNDIEMARILAGRDQYTYNEGLAQMALRRGADLNELAIEYPEYWGTTKDFIEGYDKLSQPLESDTTVYRVVRAGGESGYDIDWKIGDEFTDKGFTSTSPIKDSAFVNQAERAARAQGAELVNLEIKLPAGTDVLDMHNGYDEILLKNGSTFKVADYNPETNTYVLELVTKNVQAPQDVNVVSGDLPVTSSLQKPVNDAVSQSLETASQPSATKTFTAASASELAESLSLSKSMQKKLDYKGELLLSQDGRQVFNEENAITIIKKTPTGQYEVRIKELPKQTTAGATARQIKALGEYVYGTNGFVKINEGTEALAKGTTVNAEAKIFIDDLTELIDAQNPIEAGTKVYRTEGYEIFDQVTLADGTKLSDAMKQAAASGNLEMIENIQTMLANGEFNQVTQPHFLSTSASITGTFDGEVLWELTVAEGSKGVRADILKNYIDLDAPMSAAQFQKMERMLQYLSKEQEVLFQRNSDIPITGLRYDFDKAKWILQGTISN